MDLIEELRLRRWALENYVPADRRPADWSPVVLDEMSRRDRERGAATAVAFNSAPIRSAFVPLDPTPSRRLHPPHERLADPHLLEQIERLADLVQSLRAS